MAASQVHVLSWVWAVSAFPPEMAGLRTCKPLIVYSFFIFIFWLRLFVFNYLLFPIIVKTSSLDHFSLMSQSLFSIVCSFL